MNAHSRLSVIAVLCSMALVVLDAGIANVAMPTLSASMHVDLARGIWTVTAYQAALLIGLLPAAHLAERFGQRRMFVAGLSLYLVASILCAVSSNLHGLVASRALQGFGGAVIMALGISILRTVLGTHNLGRAIGWNALTVAISSAAAPSVAASILAIANWPWLFLAKLPIGLVGMAATAGFPADRKTRNSVDIGAIAIHAATALSFFIAFDHLIEQPWVAIGMLGVSAALVQWMIFRTSTDRGPPLWPLDLLAGRRFRTSAIASVACFAGQTAGLVALPVHMQIAAGMTVPITALIITVWPVSVALTALMSGRLGDRFGPSVLCALGGATLSLGLIIPCMVRASDELVLYSVSAMICGIGFGLFQVPNNRSLFLSAPVERGAAAGGMQGSARLLGQTIGGLIVGLFLGRYPGDQASAIAMAIGSVCAAGSSIVSLTNLPRFSRHATSFGIPPSIFGKDE